MHRTFRAGSFLRDLNGWDVSLVTDHHNFGASSPMDARPDLWPSFN